MLGSSLRWPCVALLLLAVADCKPPRPYPSRGKTAKSARVIPPPAPVVSIAQLAQLAPLAPLAQLAPLAPINPHHGRSALQRREACEFKKGAMPEQTLDAEEPIGQRIPIDHFVIVMQENRSFDHYFHDLPKFGQPDVDVTPKG